MNEERDRRRRTREKMKKNRIESKK